MGVGLWGTGHRGVGLRGTGHWGVGCGGRGTGAWAALGRLLGLSGLAAPEAEPAGGTGCPGLLAARSWPRGHWISMGTWWRHRCGQPSGTWRGGTCTGSIYCWAVATSPWKPTGRTRHVTAEHLKKAFPSCSSVAGLLPGEGHGRRSCSRLVGNAAPECTATANHMSNSGGETPLRHPSLTPLPGATAHRALTLPLGICTNTATCSRTPDGLC